MQEFENYILNNLPFVESFHPYFNKALAKMIIAGGKRFRPKLLLKVVKHHEPLLVKNAYDIAYAIECLHTYSLIHDDLPCMDNAKLRRGEITIHEEYNNHTGVLVGDALNTYAFYLISNSKLSDEIKVKLIQTLSSDGGIYGMVIGQAIDLEFEKKPLSLEKLTFLHKHKTAKLIAASLKMGAIICSLDKNYQDALYNFGIKIGVLFQIHDDLIDATLSSKEAGKPTGADKDKNSFVNLLGIHQAKQYKQNLLNEALENMQIFKQSLRNDLEQMLKKYFKE